MTSSATAKARVCCVGDNTIDRYVGAITGSYVGGNALNVAVQLRRLGHDAAYFGAVGDDDDGRRILGALRSLDVDVTGVTIVPGRTANTIVRVTDEGDRVFEKEEYGVTLGYAPSDADIDRMSEFDGVHLGFIGRPEVLRDRMFGRVALMSQDCGVSPGFDHLNVAFCSCGDDPGSAKEVLSAAVAAGAKLAVATCGAAGSASFDGAQYRSMSALPTTVVDTTGAGDSYIAGFLSGLLSGRSVEDAMHTGAEFAALTCTHVAAWPQSSEGHRDG
jgi:fructoselysine 6-kinase